MLLLSEQTSSCWLLWVLRWGRAEQRRSRLGLRLLLLLLRLCEQATARGGRGSTKGGCLLRLLAK